MKKKLSILSVMTFCAVAAMAQEVGDTVISIEKPKEVIIVGNDKSTNIAIVGKDNDKNFKYVYTIEDQTNDENGGWNVDLPFLTKKPTNEPRLQILPSIAVGCIMPTNGNSTLSGRFEFGITFLRYIYRPKEWVPGISIGFGIREAILNSNKNYLFDKDGHNLTLNPVEEGVNRKSSTIRWSSLNVPIMIHQKIYKDFEIAAGTYLNYNYYASASSKYKIGETQYKTTFKGLHQKMFTYDLYAAMGWDCISVYVRYSPQNILKSTYGPQFKTIAVGLCSNF